MKVSVIITCLNAAKTIAETLDSVVAQTYKNIEIVVVDGLSKDGTQEVVNRYPVAKFKSEKDNGSSDACNKGFALASGEVITFLNADDTFASPHVVETVMKCFLNDPEVGYVGGAIQWVLPESGRKTNICYSRPDRMIHGCTAFLPGSFIRKSIVKDPPFTDEIDFANDYDILCDILVGQKCKYMVVDDVVVNFLLGGRSNVSKNRITGKIDMFKVRRKYFGLPAAVAFAIPEFSTAILQRAGFRPYTWLRKMREA